MRYVLIPILIGLSFIGCLKKPQNNYVILEFDYFGKDTCYFLKTDTGSIEAKRTIEIIENTIADTVKLGYGVIPGRFTGKVMYLQNKEVDMYAESFYEADLLPKTDRLCFYPYFEIKTTGRLKIKLYL